MRKLPSPPPPKERKEIKKKREKTNKQNKTKTKIILLTGEREAIRAKTVIEVMQTNGEDVRFMTFSTS